MLSRDGHNAVIACGGDELNASCTGVLENGAPLDALIVPRGTETESSYFRKIIKDVTPSLVVVPENFGTGGLKKGTKLIRTQSADITLWGDTHIKLSGEKDPVMLEYGGFTMMFSFYPGYTSKKASDLHADVLFARAKVPSGFDFSRFGIIIISDEKMRGETAGNFVLCSPGAVSIGVKSGKWSVQRLET